MSLFMLRHWRRAQILGSEAGVTMVEATIGVVFLLFLALGAIQLVLVLHGSLAVRGAAMRAARAHALSPGDPYQPARVFVREVGLTLGGLEPHDPSCIIANIAGEQVARCTGAVTVPTILPGAGLFGAGGLKGPILVTASGNYPMRKGP